MPQEALVRDGPRNEIDAELRTIVGRSRPQGRRTGVEQEFRVIGPTGPVDFRTLLDASAPDGFAIVPDDPRGHRGRGGGLLTADGAEAEIATAPVDMRPGFTSELQRLIRVEHGRLTAYVGSSMSVEGWSTHLNVEVVDDAGLRVAHLLATRFSPALMMLMDRRESPGLLVRCRPSRIELGGEYLVGDQLRAAMLMAAGATLACERAVATRTARRSLPPALHIALEPARARFGHYVDRRALGTDLYERGRPTPIRTRWCRTTTAQDHLSRCWAIARAAAAPIAEPEELALVDAMVAGELPLPVEQPAPGPTPLLMPPPDRGGDPLDPVARPCFSTDAVVATWSFTVYRIRGARILYVCVPARDLVAFHAALRRGALDGVLGRELDAEPSNRVLRSSDQTGGIGVFDRIGDAAGLTPNERDPLTGLPFGGGGGRAGRQAKRRAELTPAPIPRTKVPVRRTRAIVIAAAVVVILVAIAATALAVTGGGSHKGTSAVATTSQPRATTTTGPFSPSAAQLPAVRLAGTYDLVRTVVKSDNITAPLGTKEKRVYQVANTCTTQPPCHFEVAGAKPADAFSLPFNGRTYVLDSRGVGDCYDGTTGKSVVKGGALTIFHQELRASEVQVRHGVLVATKLTGTAFLTAKAQGPAGTCSIIRPVTYSAVATLRG